MKKFSLSAVLSILIVVCLSAYGGGGGRGSSHGSHPPTGGTGGSGTLETSGGTLTTDIADVTARAGAALQPITVTVTSVDPPAGLPTELTPVGKAVNIDVTNQDVLNEPLIITLKYSDSGLTDENNMAVVHYNNTLQHYEPVTVLAHDTTANTFKIDSRTFSPFLVVRFLPEVIPSSYTVPGFDPSRNGWNINNFGSYFAPGGNCLGMSGYAVWFFGNRTDFLNGKYSATGSPSIAELVAMRAHLAQSQYWANITLTATMYEELITLGPAETVQLMRLYLSLFKQPLILLLEGPEGPAFRHASVVYGYDANSFTFYDVNHKNETKTVGFNNFTWGTYVDGIDEYNHFSFVALPSLGRTEDFAGLTAQAEEGFTSSDLISVTSPTEGQQIAAHEANLSGSLSGDLSSSPTLVAYAMGMPQEVPVNGGAFSATIPIASGENTIVLLANPGNPENTLFNWFPHAATLIRTVNGTLPRTTFLATLTWNQDNTDVDLYVTEPAPSSQTAWFQNRSTSNLLDLDFDNTSGYGPEHSTLTTLTTGGGNAGGTVLPGNYIVRVHYYSDHDTGQAVTGTVYTVVNEGTPQRRMDRKTFSIPLSNPANDAPGSSGDDWVDIATVEVVVPIPGPTPTPPQ